VTADADGCEPLRLRREVLSGTTTTLDLSLVPLLTAEVEEAAARNVVRVTFQRVGQQVCRTGLLRGR